MSGPRMRDASPNYKPAWTLELPKLTVLCWDHSFCVQVQVQVSSDGDFRAVLVDLADELERVAAEIRRESSFFETLVEQRRQLR